MASIKYSSNAYEGFRLTQVSLGFKESGIFGVPFEANDSLSKEAISGLNFGIFGIGVARGRISAGEGGRSIIGALTAGIAKVNPYWLQQKAEAASISSQLIILIG